MKHFRSISPHDNSILGEVAITTAVEVGELVDKARAALPAWKELGLAGRSKVLKRFIDVFGLHAEEFATLASKEMGMPIASARSDVQDAIHYFSWYLDNAEKSLAPALVHEDAAEVSMVYREPFGVVASIVPWNYPASNFVWSCGQALIAGNTIVFKSSEEVPLCGVLLEKMFKEAGMPEGVFNEVYGRGPVGALLSRQNVDLICFTGSTEVGLSLYRVAAQNMIPINMELGGSAPGIVFADADLDEAVESIYSARFSNSGQMCDALKRLIVHESLWDIVAEKLADKLRMVTLGDPLNTTNSMGPLVSKKQVETLERQVADALNKGALVMAGGKKPPLEGSYYEPTLIANITTEMRVWREETFGPVLPMVKFSTEEEAIALANDTDYGLGAYVYTKDAARAERIAQAIQTGMVSVNGGNYVRPMNPFGGYKNSGLGRQHGTYGFEDVTQVKVVTRKK